MTKALKKVFEAASRLPDRQQNELAAPFSKNWTLTRAGTLPSPLSGRPKASWPMKRWKRIGQVGLSSSTLMPFDFEDDQVLTQAYRQPSDHVAP
jgi:hypothetical protein